MKLTLLTILGLAAAAPLDTDSAAAEQNVDKKGVYMCQQKDFAPEGACKWTEVIGSTGCKSWRCGDDGHACDPWLKGAWLSFGPDRGVKCTLYAAENCRIVLRHDNIEFPGTGDLVQWSKDVRVSAVPTAAHYLSYMCWA